MSSRGNWAKDDREKTELIPGKETHSRSEKSLADFIASILEGPWNRGAIARPAGRGEAAGRDPAGLSALNGAKAGAFAYGSCLKTRLV